MRLFDSSGIKAMSPACVADMISLPSRASRSKRISAPTCEVPANASCPRFGEDEGLNPGAALASLHDRWVSARGITDFGLMIEESVNFLFPRRW